MAANLLSNAGVELGISGYASFVDAHDRDGGWHNVYSRAILIAVVPNLTFQSLMAVDFVVSSMK